MEQTVAEPPMTTGVPVLDTIIYITWGALFIGAMVYSILKIFGKNSESKDDKDFGRRAEDLTDMKGEVEDHEDRLRKVETNVAVNSERTESIQRELGEFKGAQETFRKDTRDNTIAIHAKLDKLLERD